MKWNQECITEMGDLIITVWFTLENVSVNEQSVLLIVDGV